MPYPCKMVALTQLHDCLLLDLDGTVFRGSQPIDGALETLAEIATCTLFMTNNASRNAIEVAQHLRELGFDAEPDNIVTSAQCAARLLGTELASGSPVLIVGSEALATEVANVGLRPVRRWADGPLAIVQGFSAHTSWRDLAEAALAIRGGTPWVATNVDLTLPSEHGLVPGNGSLVAALKAATGANPRVIGKPYPAIFQDALARGDFQRPLVVGDRLDTDIAGANRLGLPSLLVLSGVSTAADVIRAQPDERPTYIAHDLRGINHDSDSLRVAPQCDWQMRTGDDVAALIRLAEQQPDNLSLLRAAAHASWTANHDDPHPRSPQPTMLGP